MRSATGPELASFSAPLVRYTVVLEITNQNGTWKTLTNMGGLNFLKSWTVGATIDDPLQTASFVLKKTMAGQSLAPLISASPLNVDNSSAYSPLIFENRQVRFSVAIVPAGGSASQKPIFQGKLDAHVEEGRDTITMTCRDTGAYLMDNFIDAERRYSTSAGTDVETIMQQVIDDNMGLVTLHIPASPNWKIRQYSQSKTSVLEAIRTLALQIAWDLRYRWTSADVFQLELFDPVRAPGAPLYTFGPSEYLDIPSFGADDESIRNFVRVWYTDKASKTRNAVQVYDLTSISDYGKRYMELAEEPTSNIDSNVEALLMANGALADLKDPEFTKVVRTKLFWAAELGDNYAFLANASNYDQDQEFAVIGWSHSGDDKGSCHTDMTLRGKPLGAFREWLRKERFPGKDTFYPAPKFSDLIGEESSMGGNDNDGMVWLRVEFEINTSVVRIFAEEGIDTSVPIPDVTEITKAWEILRPEGDIGAFDNFVTYVGMATRPNFWKRIRAIGYNEKDLAGPEWTPEPVQALDHVPPYVDGIITNFSLSVIPGGTGYSLTIAVGAIDATTNSYLMVMRNGIVVYNHWLGNTGSVNVVFDDSGLNITSEYIYRVFIWTNGQSGGSWMWVKGVIYPPGANTPTVPNPTTTYPIPTFTNGTPKLGTAMGVQTIDIDWALADAGANFLHIEESYNGTNWTILSTFGGSPPVSGGVQTPQVVDKWIRLRAEGGGITRGVSIPYYFSLPQVVPPGAGTGNPPTGGGVVPQPRRPYFVNNTPKLGFVVITGVIIEWACVDTVPTSIDVEYSPDNGTTPWATLVTAPTVASGQTVDPNTTAKWYRLRTHTAGVTRYISGSLFYGTTTPVSGNQYPTFTISPATSLLWANQLKVAWTCPTNLANLVNIEVSTDDGVTNPWVQVASSGAVANGYWYTTDIGTPLYYRMNSFSGATKIATSPSQYWPGTPVV